jgi:hypothetical protein
MGFLELLKYEGLHIVLASLITTICCRYVRPDTWVSLEIGCNEGKFDAAKQKFV